MENTNIFGSGDHPSPTQGIAASYPNYLSNQVSSDDASITSPVTVLFSPENLNLQWTGVIPIGAGLMNNGNTCFMNACLQCLAYTPPFANYMLSRSHSATCDELGLCMMCVMQNLIHEIYRNPGTAIMPWTIQYLLRYIGRQFGPGRQEDAHEFLMSILEAMQQSCLSGVEFDTATKNTTFIHQVFGGSLRSRVTCLNCQGVSDTFETCLDILLNIETADTVSEALLEFVRPESLGGCSAYKCSKCHQTVTAMKSYNIHNSPNVLALTFKRFDSFNGEKIIKDVKYPEHLDLQPFISHTKGQPETYQLYAVLVHSGLSCANGHYYCYIKSSHGIWFKVDDSIFTRTDIDIVLEQQAYILFYIRSMSDVKDPTSPGSEGGISSATAAQFSSESDNGHCIAKIQLSGCTPSQTSSNERSSLAKSGTHLLSDTDRRQEVEQYNNHHQHKKRHHKRRGRHRLDGHSRDRHGRDRQGKDRHGKDRHSRDRHRIDRRGRYRHRTDQHRSIGHRTDQHRSDGHRSDGHHNIQPGSHSHSSDRMLECAREWTIDHYQERKGLHNPYYSRSSQFRGAQR